MSLPLSNSFEGGTNGTTLTNGNTGGTSGSAFDSINAGTGTTVAFSNTQSMHGTLSCKIATGSTSAAGYATWSTSLGTVTSHAGRIYLFLTGAPGSSDAFIQFQTAGLGWNGGIQLTTAKQLLMQLPSFATAHTFTTVMALSTWYRLEWQLTCSTTVGQITVSLYLGDSATATETYTGPASQNWGTSVGAVLIGWTGAHASQPAVYVDDAALAATGPIGPVATTLSGAAALDGSGTLGGKGAFAGTAALSGTGKINTPRTNWMVNALDGHGDLAGTGSASIGALLSGSGTLGLARTVIWQARLALSGSGTMAVNYQQVPLSGSGTLGISGVRLGYTLPMSGSGTLAVLQVLGGLVAATSAATAPYAYPGTSLVAVAPPNSNAWVYLGTIGRASPPVYSFTCPGGSDKMSCTVMVPATYRNQAFNPGWQVRITRGGHTVWTGKLDEPVATSTGTWTFTAVGDGNRAQDFLAIYSSAWPANQPDESINNAIARGLPWVNKGMGTPAGAWYGQQVDSGAQNLGSLLNLICTRGGLTWYASSQPGGLPGTDISIFPLPTVVNRVLVCTDPVARTLGGDINTIYIRYQSAGDTTSGTTSVPATYGLTSVTNAQSVAAHGVMETFIDISDAGTITAAAAQAMGNQVLSIYQRASFAGPFRAVYGQLLNPGGQPIDPGTDQAGTFMRPILTDYGYGGEVSSQIPVEFLVGSYEWDDGAQVATITPYVNVDQSLAGLLSLANTAMIPIAAA